MNILIIEDNPTISENISLYFEAKWHFPRVAKNGAIAFDMIQRENYDFLIVDRMIPEIDGLSLIRMLHARSLKIPFLFLTALGKQVDKIEGLSLGADDYLVKPFDLEELRLRIENILKRQGKIQMEKSNEINIGDISIDIEANLIKKWTNQIIFSPKEYAILFCLLKNRGKILDRDFLYESVWGEYDASDETLETINVHIANIRKKIGNDIIRTVKLRGYIIDKN